MSNYLVKAAALCLAGALTSCGSGGGAPIATVPASEEGVQVSISGAGGTITVTDPASPFAGATVTIPPGAIGEGFNVQISITHEDALPGPFLADAVAQGMVAVSKTMVLSKNVAGTFDQPLEITVPYAATQIDAEDVPSVLYWDEKIQSYTALAVTNFDPLAGTVTFVTIHFENMKVVVVSMKGLGKKLRASFPAPQSAVVFAHEELSALSVDTGFRPQADGFYRINISSYSAPGGNCLGMASFSDWFYEQAKVPQNSGIGLFSSYREGNLASQDDDIVAEELIVRAHAAGSQAWGERLRKQFSHVSQFQTGQLLIQTLATTKKPQIFLMWGNPPWWKLGLGASWGHALVVYRYSAVDGIFYVYDSNFPRDPDDTVGVRFDSTGFTGLTKTGVYSPEPNEFAFDTTNSIYAPADMQTLFDAANTGWTGGQFGTIDVASLGFNPDGRTAIVADRENVRLAGTVTMDTGDVANAPDQMDVYLAGSVIGSFPVSGTIFDIPLPQLPDTTSTEILMVAYKQGPLGNRTRSMYGTFKRFRIKSGSVLENWGFEKGNFDFWQSVRFLWSGGGRIDPSDKSGVVSSGFDPIATTIAKVLHGVWAVRVNNQDNNYHISQIVRDVQVPADTTAFSLAFNWAAVLEDPGHIPSEQPYVNVRVVNITRDEMLYERRYYSNDPSYPGWQSFRSGQWKAIDWQSVTLNSLERYQGETLRVTVEAADCALGAHGGYAYFDADE
ncbi:MAG: hypothetical protein AAB552_01465 [Patescibacteria group bacterium]